MADRADLRRSTVANAIAEAAPRLSALSTFLWSNPEVSRQEVKAHAELTDLLEELGFHVHRHALTATDFVASHTVGGAPEDDAVRPHVAFLCEYDALPEVGHACGHNLIAACAVGAALGARAGLGSGGSARGRITVLGCPAEETDGGKLDFIADGFFRDVDAALMAHPFGGPRNIAAPRTNALVELSAEFRARPDAGPEVVGGRCRVPAPLKAHDATVQAYQGTAFLRSHVRSDCRLPTVISAAGLCCSLRGPSVAAVADLERRWRAMMEAVAAANDCVLVLPRHYDAYAELRPNWRLCAVYRGHAAAAGVATEATAACGWSTDAGNVSHEVPTLHATFEIGSTAENHQREFAHDAGREAAMAFVLRQANALAMTALDILTDAELRREVWSDFERCAADGEDV